MKYKAYILIVITALLSALALAGPPTCSVCVTQQNIPVYWQGTVMQEWVDGGIHYTEYLPNPGAVMCLHNPCTLTAFANQCDSTTSNKVVKVLMTCPPSTNAVASYLWMPQCAHAASWSVSWVCSNCQVVETPSALYICSGCNTNQ